MSRSTRRWWLVIELLDLRLTSALIGKVITVFSGDSACHAHWYFPVRAASRSVWGKALADAFVEAREVFQEVDHALGQNLSRLMFEGPADDLKLTENAQPALMAVSLAVIRVLDKQGGFPSARRGAICCGA